MEAKIDQKTEKNEIKNKSDFKTKTDPRPARSDPQAWSPGAPLAPSRLVFQKTKDHCDRAENDERTKGKEQKMTNGPRGKSRKSRKKTKWTKRKDIIPVI